MTQIKCAVVARGTFVVCEYDASDDFSSSDDLLESARRVLGRIPRNSSDTYTFLGHHFHYTISNYTQQALAFLDS